MRLKTITPHVHDGRSLNVGDEYTVADPRLAEAIVAGGMAAAVPAAAPAAPGPTKKHK